MTRERATAPNAPPLPLSRCEYVLVKASNLSGGITTMMGPPSSPFSLPQRMRTAAAGASAAMRPGSSMSSAVVRTGLPS